MRAITRAAKFAAATTAALLTLTACATIMHGTNQDVGISSSPTGAFVSIDNMDKGVTPLITKLSRKDNHIVRIAMAGYAPFEATMTRSVSGWVWGNIAFGGLIGLAVDAVTGGLYKLSPEQVTGTLAVGHAGATKTGDGIYVVVVLKPQDDWVKIAQLQR